MGKVDKPWTDDDLVELKRLVESRVNEQPSYGAIGRLMDRSKGSIIGKAKRLREKALIAAGEPIPPPKPRLPKPMKLQAMNRSDPSQKKAPTHVALHGETLAPLGLPGEPLPSARACAYISGDPREAMWAYCARPVRGGSSYCESHHSLCLRPAPERKR